MNPLLSRTHPSAAKRSASADIPFRFHDLRHYYVSIAHALGVPDAYTMRMGGWRTDRTMKRVYRSTLADLENKEQARHNAHFEQEYEAS